MAKLSYEDTDDFFFYCTFNGRDHFNFQGPFAPPPFFCGNGRDLTGGKSLVFTIFEPPISPFALLFRNF